MAFLHRKVESALTVAAAEMWGTFSRRLECWRMRAAAEATAKKGSNYILPESDLLL